MQNQATDELLQQQASQLPKTLVEAMAKRDGPQEGGLTLSREHIVTLNRYTNHVFALPDSQDNTERWLGYKEIDEPELSSDAMLKLFNDLRAHARRWGPLSDRSKGLAAQLAATANAIGSSGETIVEECRRIRALGPQVNKWEQVQFAKPVELDTQDRRSVATLVDYLAVIKEDVEHYARCVQQVRQQTEEFRDEARFKLVPAVNQKSSAIKRKQNNGTIEQLRERLAELDKEIEALRKEYDQYVAAAIGGLAAGPIGIIITGSIYGSKAESTRKRRTARQQERHQTSQQLRAEVNLEGRLEELATFMSELDTRLQDVITAASHLQTAWQIVESYIDASIEKLGRIRTNQELSRFIIYFRQFLAQWGAIEQTSLQLTRIFDEAISAH